MLLTMVAAVSIASMMPMSWKAAGRSDYVGKATGLLQDELEWRQYQTMRGVDPTTLEYPEAGQVIVEGDTTFTVFTITSPVAGHPNTWTINVRVTWPGNTKGVVSSVQATRQLGFNNLDQRWAG